MEDDTGHGDRVQTPVQEHGAPGSVESPDYEMQFDLRDEVDNVTIGIAEGVSDVKDVPVTDIIPPLSDVIDPSALENIFRPLPGGRQRNGWVTFFLHGCKVIVTSDGLIRIYDLEEPRG